MGNATVGQIAQWVAGTAHGDADYRIDDLAPLGAAGPRHLSFLANPRYENEFLGSSAGAVLVRAVDSRARCIQIECADPYLAMAQVAQKLYPLPDHPGGISPQAIVDPSATVHSTAVIEAGAVVTAGAHVGPQSRVGGGAYLGRDSVVGERCLLHPGSRVLHRCRLGDRVILHSGAVIGADGFGYAPDAKGVRHKIPQVGIVVLEDDVEVGANSTIDRATFGETRVGQGTKIDNLVQIAHNVVTGEHCVVISQSGIAGSTTIGQRVVVGAQVGVVGHAKIADDVILAARAGVPGNINQAGVYSGVPAMPHRQWLRVAATQRDLPGMRRRLREVEAELAGRRSASDKDDEG